jgi:hypothetical protein
VVEQAKLSRGYDCTLAGEANETPSGEVDEWAKGGLP